MRRGNRDPEYGLHRIIYQYVSDHPGLRAKDIRYGKEVDDYIKTNGYSRSTVSPYLSSMRVCGMVICETPDPYSNPVYVINPTRRFDKRIIQNLDHYYRNNNGNGTAGWDRDAVWEMYPDIDAILDSLIDDHGLIRFTGAVMEALERRKLKIAA